MMRTAEETRPERIALKLTMHCRSRQPLAGGHKGPAPLIMTENFTSSPQRSGARSYALLQQVVNSAADPVQDRGAPASK